MRRGPRFSEAARGHPRPQPLQPPPRPRPEGGIPGGRAARALLSESGAVTPLARLAPLLLAALLAGAPSAPVAEGPADARREAAAELARLAPRIEDLKAQAAAGHPAGPELERLLARAQELAAVLERLDRAGARAVPAPAPGPDAQELRERADALRDRADRLAAELAATERRIAEARRQAELADRLEAVAGPGDLFAESLPRRARAERSGGTVDVGGPQPGGSPAVAPAQAIPSAPAPATVQPGGAGAEALPSGGDDLRGLRRHRGELAWEIASLRARAEALQAEARALDAAR